VANDLAIVQATATVGGIINKVRSVPLWWRVEKLTNGVVTPIVPDEDAANPNIVQTMSALWDADGNDRTGGYVYAPVDVASLNFIPLLGAPTGAQYRLSVATPVVWVDGVQLFVTRSCSLRHFLTKLKEFVQYDVLLDAVQHIVHNPVQIRMNFVGARLYNFPLRVSNTAALVNCFSFQWLGCVQVVYRASNVNWLAVATLSTKHKWNAARHHAQ
jgi:hypothetical protein